MWVVFVSLAGPCAADGPAADLPGLGAFVETHCLACHGESLEGNGPAKTLVGPEFAANWNGITMGDMLDRTRTSMPLAKPGTLSRQQVADLLAFVLSVNKFPAGEYELPRQAEVLTQITFLATRPDRDAHQTMR